LALAQINTLVGDLEGNFEKIVRFTKEAKEKGADIIAFPELSITGYPPEDLLLKQEFIGDNLKFLHKLIPYSKEITIITGFVDERDDIFNSAATLHHGELVNIYHKQYLPNYGVFDEDRYFQKGLEIPILVHQDIHIGVSICEDIWYPYGPARDQALYGNAEIIINISASPYSIGKGQERLRMMAQRAIDNTVIVAYVNLVGAQDELVFDGNSMIVSEEGVLIARAPAFKEDLVIVDLFPDKVLAKRLRDPRRRKEKFFIPAGKIIQRVVLPAGTAVKKKPAIVYQSEPFARRTEEIYEALKLGLKDYVHKNRFEKVVLGLSGGIDSALVCTIAADALGAENVIGVAMPSAFTSKQSKADAKKIAENLGITFYEIPISNLLKSYLQELHPCFKGTKEDITEENIQARIRGNIVMALSNKFGWLVLATGNKSEIAVGYCTLYGDMAGGFSVIKDIPKGLVYELSRYRNNLAGRDIIPKSILEKPPSAELRPGQKDTDSLPPYEILDPILQAYVEEDRSYDEIVSMGFPPDVVRKIIRMVDGNEYKRRQGAPGIKITHRAFGKDWRFPITNRYGKNG
ncbi:MAG: NAD+ synthase, partial [Calditrichia bacterium]